MKRDLYIELIADFMLSTPGRPFEEVHIYALEIGAGEDELKEAIFKVSKLLAERRIKAKRSGSLSSFEKFEPGMSVIEEKTEDSSVQTADEAVERVSAKITQSLDSIVEAKLAQLLAQKEEELKNNLQTQPFAKDLKSKEEAKKQEKIVASVVKKSRFPKFRALKIPATLYRMQVSTRMMLLFFVAPVLLAVSGLFLYQQNSANFIKSSKNTGVVAGAKKENKKPIISFGPPVVFASQEKLDPKRIFSFPQTNISLDYTGLPKKTVFGFFPYWMLGVANVVNIDVYSTISLFGLTTDGKGNIVTSKDGGTDEGWAMWNSKEIDQFINRAKKKRIKVVLTVKSFNNEDIESLVRSDAGQRKFISNIIQLVNLKSLAGVNIDFEYIGTPAEDVTFGFTRLIANLNSELKRQIPEAHLSIDTYLKSGGQRDLFDVQLLQDYVDAIIVMGYDVHTPNGSAGPVSPMEGEYGILGFMQSYLERVSASKLILAVPYYGYDWPVIGPASEQSSGSVLSYAEIAATNTEDSILWNEQTQTPYYQYQDSETGAPREVHFENSRSLGVKYDYVKKKNLQGIGVWAMGYEGKTLELEQVILEKFAK